MYYGRWDKYSKLLFFFSFYGFYRFTLSSLFLFTSKQGVKS